VAALEYSQERTPNQEFRRRQVVVAAARVLRKQGVGGCTVRAVAAEVGMSKSALQYYVADADELVDLGFAALQDSFLEHIDELAAGHNADDAFWIKVIGTASPWGEHFTMSLLLAEYYVKLGRSSDSDRAFRPFRRMVEFWQIALGGVDPALALRAIGMTRYLSGLSIVQEGALDRDQLIDDIAGLTSIPRPTDVELRCQRPNCPFHATV
jgi:AcrR family transcriptional regulator